MDVTARTERVAQQTAAGVTIVKQETTVTAVKVRGADDSDDDFGVDDMVCPCCDSSSAILLTTVLGR